MTDAIGLAKQSDSTIIILLVVIAIILVALIPVFKVITKYNSVKRKEDYDRETRLLTVIEKNTEVNTALKTLIETDQKFCTECRQKQFEMFRKVFDNQEIANVRLAEISQALKLSGEEVSDK